ncbi:axin-1-like [Lethenteron reissneri]|uniref:axin-1-like n=1 Tax=Lethenteron reissneri TaxID=7753 RepID=UPI002AB68F05|nr:axin-1-like [Lethenteron reissneri]XP_061412363.1 axin-1-like [Lethenteron reissneri]
MDIKAKNLDVTTYLLDAEGNFMEDTPRPPVPGEEDQVDVSKAAARAGQNQSPYVAKGDALKGEATTATPRRADYDLGYEPEGSASPTPPYVRWGESLHSLLDDRDGTHLFRTFLEQEELPDMLDFWFACNGFRNLLANKMGKAARLIYKRYVSDTAGVVAAHLKAATRAYVRDCVLARGVADPTVFDQAQLEIQQQMEENSYPAFLKSELYLEYARAAGCCGEASPGQQLQQQQLQQQKGGEQGSGSGSGSCSAGMPVGYLPTLNEDEEWRGAEAGLLLMGEPFDALALASELGNKLLMATWEPENDAKEYYPTLQSKPVPPYHVNAGHTCAPATSANDSEQSISSDAMTDDSMSMTDSSVDGIPPYRFKKQQRREMHRSIRANGRVALPHFPRTSRLPKEMGPVDPKKFAADLISRLELVKRERDAQEGLEERLQRLREEEESLTADVSAMSGCGGRELLLPLSHQLHPFALLMRAGGVGGGGGADAVVAVTAVAPEDDPESILDEHVSRVMGTPGQRSPLRGRSPERRLVPRLQSVFGTPLLPALNPQQQHQQLALQGQLAPATSLAAPAAVGCGRPGHKTHVQVHHHHVHHHGPEGDAAAPQRPPYAFAGAAAEPYGGVRTSGPDAYGSGKGIPAEEADRARLIWKWMMEGERESGKHHKSPHSGVVGKKAPVCDTSRGSSSERVWGGGGGVGGGGCGGAGGTGGAVGHGTGPPYARRAVQPSHPFLQDPAMPPLPAPNTTVQLEEAKRRLEEEWRAGRTHAGKQRYAQEVMQRGRSMGRPGAVPVPSMVPAVSDMDLSQSPQDRKPVKKAAGSACTAPEGGGGGGTSGSSIVVAYYFCGEPIPYRTTVKGRVLSLGQFKELLTKKGNYRYYFKKASDEFECGVVFEEVREDSAVLPVFEEKIIGKVEKVD